MKFKKEQYIKQRVSKNGTITFQVRVRNDDVDITKSFNEVIYGGAKTAYECAIKYRNKILVDVAEGNVLKKCNLTVQDMFDIFLKTTVLSYSTQLKHEKLFNKYFLHKDVKVQQLTRAIIIEDLNAMVDVATDDTIARVYSIWKRDIIETALNRDIIVRDLTLGLNVPKSHIYSIKKSTATNRDTILKVEELLWNANDYKHKIYYYMLETMYYTGMRPAEVEVLTRDDIQGNYISVNKELGSNKTQSNIVRRPKTQNSIRKIPIHPNLKKLLEELDAFAKTDNLFADENGKYMNSTDIGNAISRLTKPKGIKFNMYMLRHNLATELITNRVDEKTTMEILGHTNFNMSLYYANSNDELKENAIELLA